jgi:hypothetical protein
MSRRRSAGVLAEAFRLFTGQPAATKAPVVRTTLDPKKLHLDLIAKNVDLSAVPPETIAANKASAKVYFDAEYFPDEALTPGSEEAFSLHRLLGKTASVCIAGDVDVMWPDGSHTDNPEFMAKLTDGSEQGLSPAERRIARKAVIASKAAVTSYGGYPASNLKQKYHSPKEAVLISQAASQFEISYLEAELFLLDAFNQSTPDPRFSSCYPGGIAPDYTEVSKMLGDYDTNGDFTRLRDFPLYIARHPVSGRYHRSCFSTTAVILNRQAYFNTLVKDIVLQLSIADDFAAKDGRLAHVKATASGMGFFAKLAMTYDISGQLFPTLLAAYKHVLENYHFPHIDCVEFPIQTHGRSECFKLIFESTPQIGDITVFHCPRDLLDFTGLDPEKVLPVAVIAGDANAFAGNEWFYGSVDSMVGNNSDIRLTQVPLTNPLLLDPSHQVAVTIDDGSHTYSLSSASARLSTQISDSPTTKHP